MAIHAPERIALPGGRQLKVHYEAGKPPWVESRLQDFFGLKEGPRIGGGRLPLVLHLLAPNHRPVQVTSDLSGFWERHYPSIRRELARKYPRHAWPENPLQASPPSPRARR
jgi:ATP-dependent helicase HrpB